MEGERYLLSNHADIQATINNAIDHFLYEESSGAPNDGFLLNALKSLFMLSRVLLDL